MRVIKSPAEIQIMKKSTDISCEAFIQVMKSTKYIHTEAQLEATMEYHCRLLGSERLAYPPVVSNGITNNILHYISNDNVLSNGNLILMDAGGEYNNFSSDITRTWPVNGRFSDPQREVYTEVLDILKKCTLLARSDNKMSLDMLQHHSMDLMAQSLKRLKLISPSAGRSQTNRFYPHTIGHWVDQ